MLYHLTHLPSPERASDFIRKGTKSFPSAKVCCVMLLFSVIGSCFPKGSKKVRSKSFIFIQTCPCNSMSYLGRCQFHLCIWYDPRSSTSSYPLASSLSCIRSLGSISSVVSMAHVHVSHCTLLPRCCLGSGSAPPSGCVH